MQDAAGSLSELYAVDASDITRISALCWTYLLCLFPGKPRGYAFIEYEHKNNMKEAYKRADGKKVEGKRVVVDVERGRTVPNWYALQGMCHWMHIAHAVIDMRLKHASWLLSALMRYVLQELLTPGGDLCFGACNGYVFIYVHLELQFIWCIMHGQDPMGCAPLIVNAVPKLQETKAAGWWQGWRGPRAT